MAKKITSASFFMHDSKSQSRTNIDEGLTCFCDVESVRNEEIKKQSEDSYEESEKSEITQKEPKKSLWQTILEESEQSARSFSKLPEEQETKTFSSVNSPASYLDREIFPVLLTAMEKMLVQAGNLGVLRVQKSRFNGLDYLAEYLWNSNPRWSSRTEWLDVHQIPRFKLSMRLHPRPIFPKSWLWSVDEAATRIQRYVRGWLVRKQEDVQEMRQFWKLIKNDKGSLDLFEDSARFKDFNMCERYKLLAKKREKPY